MSNNYMDKYLQARKSGINRTTLLISHGGVLYEPPVLDDFVLEQERKGTPSKLTFTILDNEVDFVEGDAVRFRISRTWMFYGFIFSRDVNAEGLVKVTCYDQIRYLKNKDTYIYENKTASELIKMIAQDFNLNCGYIEDTKYKIAQKIEEDKPLIDIILNALDETLAMTGKLYVFYDHFGKLALKNIEDMAFDLLLDRETLQDFDYKASIDENVYNQIKLVYPDEGSGQNDIYLEKDTNNINQWGVLQLYKKIDSPVNAKAMASELLKLHNKTVRQLTIKDALGEVRVRPGCRIIVNLDLGDYKLKSYMIIESMKHKYKDGLYTMDLTVINKDFSAPSYNQQADHKQEGDTDTSDGSLDGGMGVLNGTKVPAEFSAYWRGTHTANGEKFVNTANTCAAPKEIAFNTIIQVGGTGTNQDGRSLRVTDRGGYIKKVGNMYRIDIPMKDERTCRAFGRRKGWIIIGNGTGYTSTGGSGNSKAVALARSKLGKRYVWGATGPNTFDCSGLMYWIAKQLGKSIPRTSKAQSQSGTPVSKGALRPGDLVFFGTGSRGVHHVGMYIGNDQFIHAPQTGDVVKITALSSRGDFHNARRYF